MSPFAHGCRTDPPVCQLRLLPKDRNGFIKAECRASSNPAVSSFKWIRDNETLLSLEDGERLSEDGALLTIPDSNLESYACIASNIMGSSTCRLQAHQIQGNALQTCKGWAIGHMINWQ